ncbi:MAG: hypothetical protein IJ019_05520 [Alphaproteobacteria bacterium]|nr:hypothetical protein [Alphaproteobacteria bacterium]
MSNDNLHFILGTLYKSDMSDAIGAHLDKGNISYDFFNNYMFEEAHKKHDSAVLFNSKDPNISDPYLNALIDEIIQSGKTPVLVGVKHNIELPKEVREIEQNTYEYSYDEESAIHQVLEMTGLKLDKEILYETAFEDTKARLGLDEELPIHQEKHPLDNGHTLILERKISDKCDFPWGINGELLNDMSKIPVTNTEYTTYRSGFVQDKKGNKVQLFPNEEDLERGAMCFIVNVEGNKISKFGIKDGIVCAASIATANKDGHIIIDEKQTTKSRYRDSPPTYTESKLIDGFGTKVSSHGGDRVVTQYKNGKADSVFHYNYSNELDDIQVLKDGEKYKEAIFKEGSISCVKYFTKDGNDTAISYRHYDDNGNIKQECLSFRLFDDDIKRTSPKGGRREYYIFEQGKLHHGYVLKPSGYFSSDKIEIDKHSIQFIKKRAEKYPSLSDERAYFAPYIKMANQNLLTIDRQRE